MILNLITKAKDLFYNNNTSGLTATNTQDAIDEVNESLVQVYYLGSATTMTVNATANTAKAITLPRPTIPSGYTTAYLLRWEVTGVDYDLNHMESLYENGGNWYFCANKSQNYVIRFTWGYAK